MANEQNVSKAPAGRVRRTPVGTRGVIPKIEMEPGYQYRVVNDVDDRIERFEDGGWEMVEAGALKRSERRVNNPTPEGSKAQISVGQGTKAYIMRQKDEWYKADQAEKQAKVDASEQAMKAPLQNGADYGEVKLSRG